MGASSAALVLQACNSASSVGANFALLSAMFAAAAPKRTTAELMLKDCECDDLLSLAKAGA